MATSELLESVLSAYRAQIGRDDRIKGLQKKAADGRAGYQDAQQLAGLCGGKLGSVLASALAEAYPDGAAIPEKDALAVIPPALRRNHAFVREYIRAVQQAGNRRAGLGLGEVLPEFDEERAENLARHMSGQESFGDHELEFEEFVENASRGVVDDAVREEAETHRTMGLSPRIIRISSGHCCEWCDKLAGEYEYSRTMDREVFRRHANCDCTIEYDPGTGAKDVSRVNNYRKTDVRNAKAIAYRKTLNR